MFLEKWKLGAYNVAFIVALAACRALTISYCIYEALNNELRQKFRKLRL